ncbi:MAG: 30S ribosomal protein S9 [Bacteroidota bacterium]
MSQIVAVGRRKRAVARVFLNESGTGKMTINKREFDNYFPVELLRLKVTEPFRVLEISEGNYDLKINVDGGGIKGQAEAIRLGITRALIETNEEFRSPLKRAGLVTRDARKVERKKYGKKKARKSSQFSKR